MTKEKMMIYKSGDKVITTGSGPWYKVGETFTLRSMTQNYSEYWWNVEGQPADRYLLEDHFKLVEEPSKPGVKSMLEDGDRVFTVVDTEFIKIGRYLVGIGEKRGGSIKIDEFDESGTIADSPHCCIKRILRPIYPTDFTCHSLAAREYEVVFDRTHKTLITQELKTVQQQIDELVARANDLKMQLKKPL
jgi:hypothetical protein